MLRFLKLHDRIGWQKVRPLQVFYNMESDCFACVLRCLKEFFESYSSFLACYRLYGLLRARKKFFRIPPKKNPKKKINRLRAIRRSDPVSQRIWSPRWSKSASGYGLPPRVWSPSNIIRGTKIYLFTMFLYLVIRMHLRVLIFTSMIGLNYKGREEHFTSASKFTARRISSYTLFL